MSWRKAQIAKICLRTQVRDPARTPDERFRYVDISAVDRSLKVITSAPEIAGADAPSRARKEIREGDVLVSTVRPNLNAVSMVPANLDGQIASTGFCVLRPDPAVVLGKYLFYFTTTPVFVGILSSKVRGAHYPAVSDADVKDIELPLPPLSEQRRIVEILAHAEALRRSRAEADTKAARILPALFYKTFGDPATNPKRWPLKTLGDLSVDSPKYGANARSLSFRETMPRYVRITDITDDGRLSDKEIVTLDLDEWDEYRLGKNDLLFARSGATVGKTYLYHETDGLCVFAGYLIRFRLDRRLINPWVVFAYTMTPHYRSWVIGKRRAAAQPNINGQEYASLRFALPDRSLQEAFGNRAEQLKMLHGKREVATTKMDDLYSLLLHRAFTGDLTAKWREAHMKELLVEMDGQVKTLEISVA